MYEFLRDDSYLKNKLMVFRDRATVYGVKETYMSKEWRFPKDQLPKVKEAISLKEAVGKVLPGKKEDILVIYGTEHSTYDTVVYRTIIGRFSYLYDSGQQYGDTWFPN
jgi:hypothetical protein